MTDRDRVLREVMARAAAEGRRVYGFTTSYASCAELRSAKTVPAEVDRICAEGDERWVPLPVDELGANRE